MEQITVSKLHKETITKAIGRIERTVARFANANEDISIVAKKYINRIARCKKLSSALVIEKSFKSYCDAKYPLNKKEILSHKYFVEFINSSNNAKK